MKIISSLTIDTSNAVYPIVDELAWSAWHSVGILDLRVQIWNPTIANIWPTITNHSHWFLYNGPHQPLETAPAPRGETNEVLGLPHED